MKKMVKEQKFSLIMMIIFMILTDILICFNNSILQFMGYSCLLVVLGFGVYYYMVGRQERLKNQNTEVKKIIEEMQSKKKVSK